MNKKGFTLIELLAVIVILAIIALIATPIILNVIDNAKKGAAKSSVLGYIDAVEKSVAIGKVDTTKGISVPSDNDLSLENEDDSLILGKIKVKGIEPTYVSIQFEKGKIISASFCISNYSLDYNGKEILMAQTNYCTGNNIKSIKINNNESSIELFEQLQLDVEVDAEGEYTVVYSSSDESIATVSETGLVVPVSNGNVKIKAKAGYRVSVIELEIGSQCDYEIGEEFTFQYKGTEDVFEVSCTGNYKIESWGASGGDSRDFKGGYGAYSTGEIILRKKTNLYINVGQGGAGSSENLSATYNGGGANYRNEEQQSVSYRSTGGGATSIALKSGLLSTLEDSIDDIIIVSSGGGGAASYPDQGTAPGSGGGVQGSTCYSLSEWCGYGGTQTSPGTGVVVTNNGSFGKGGNASLLFRNYNFGGAGGGGGFYGGGAGYNNSGGGGGSSYIGNSSLTNKVMYCYNCTASSAEATKTVSTTCTNTNPVSNCSKQGNGYVKIKYLGL